MRIKNILHFGIFALVLVNTAVAHQVEEIHSIQLRQIDLITQELDQAVAQRLWINYHQTTLVMVARVQPGREVASMIRRSYTGGKLLIQFLDRRRRAIWILQ